MVENLYKMLDFILVAFICVQNRTCRYSVKHEIISVDSKILWIDRSSTPIRIQSGQLCNQLQKFGFFTLFDSKHCFDFWIFSVQGWNCHWTCTNLLNMLNAYWLHAAFNFLTSFSKMPVILHLIKKFGEFIQHSEFIFIIIYSYEGHTMCYVVPESLCFRKIPTSSWTKVLNQSSYLESLDNLIVESKLNKLNRKVERMSKIIYFIILNLTPATALLPTFFLTVFNHFIYDSNDQSYFLPFPLMYVETLTREWSKLSIEQMMKFKFFSLEKQVAIQLAFFVRLFVCFHLCVCISMLYVFVCCSNDLPCRGIEFVCPLHHWGYSKWFDWTQQNAIECKSQGNKKIVLQCNA